MTTTAYSNNLQSIIYSNTGGSNPKLKVLDQLLVPHQKVYIDIPNVEAAWTVIRTMQIRGAPLIAIVACLGLAVDLATHKPTISELRNFTSLQPLLAYIKTKTDYLRTSRPTAVNLFNAMDELNSVLLLKRTQLLMDDSQTMSTRTFSELTQIIVQATIDHAEFMLKRDISDNEAIGYHGAQILLQNALQKKNQPNTNHLHNNIQQLDDTNNENQPKIKLMTICNTGSLATAGYGTALGVARTLHSSQKLHSITALETRPYNQGSRLTAFEIVQEEMPNGTLICDSASAAYMKTHGVDACVVGADRVCANGDTANKIGTYMLAIVAKAHNVPFYVAAPFTTLDVTLESGDRITIEERSKAELIESSCAPKDIGVWNPAFDVTPADLISGIITEKGVIIDKREDGTFDVPAFVAQHTNTKAK
jgi:eIF-2B alpha/beta/delta-like uncharacterized protein